MLKIMIFLLLYEQIKRVKTEKSIFFNVEIKMLKNLSHKWKFIKSCVVLFHQQQKKQWQGTIQQNLDVLLENSIFAFEFLNRRRKMI